MNGKRYRSCLAFFESDDARWAVALLAVSIEPSKVLTWFWLSCLGNSLKAGSRPPIYKLLDPKASVVVQALQHFSSLLSSTDGSGRLLLLWSISGYGTYKEFCRCQPCKTREIRRVLLLAAGWCFRRHYVYLNDLTFALSALGDPEGDPGVLARIAEEWDRKSHCCVGPGICRDLKRLGLSSEQLRSPGWKDLLRWIGSAVQFSMADVEALHSQNKHLAGCAFHNIASKFINTESRRLMREAEELQQLDTGTGKGHGLADSSDSGKRSLPGGIEVVEKCRRTGAKAMSALELFRVRYLALQRGSASDGSKVNCCNAEHWAEVKREWENLSADQRAVYESMAQDSRSQAALVRAQRDQRAAAQTELAEATTVRDLAVQTAFRGVHAQVLPMWQLCRLMLSAEGEDVESILKRMLRLHAEGRKAVAQSKYPLCEQALESAWQSQLAQGLTGKQAAQKFQTEAERSLACKRLSLLLLFFGL